MAKTKSKQASSKPANNKSASRTAGAGGTSLATAIGAASTGASALQGDNQAHVEGSQAKPQSQLLIDAPKTTNGTAGGMTDASSPVAIEALKRDHRKVEGLFARYESSTDEEAKARLIQEICSELIIHTKLEEEIFYPACRDAISEEDLLDEAQVEHDSAKVLIADLLNGDPDDRYRDAKVAVLAEQVKHHVGEEEKPTEGIFARAEEHGVAGEDLARRLRERKQELQGRAAGLRPTRAVSINASALEELDMPRFGNDRDRDDRGRFMSDDDDRGGRQVSRGRSRYEDDDDRRGGQDRDRDERGRFMSDDDDERGSRGGRGQGGWSGDFEGHSRAARSRFDDDDRRGGSRGRGRDDDDGDGRGRGRGGWFGDSEGHSQAARSRFDDDDRRSSRGRGRDDDDDRDGRGQGRGGWFGDSEGHSQAARSRFDDDDDRRSSRGRGRDDDDDGRGHGRGGWFGDSEGHSRAARSRFDDDDRRGGSRGRGRDDDDDGRGHGRGGWFGDSEGHSRAARSGGSSQGGSRSQGGRDDGRGWFGDSRGHAEASRRGWENRR
jgi:hypothetical protein